MNNFNTNQRIGDIVIKFPNVTEIFKKYKIDFCCGGNRLLMDVIKEQNINESDLVNEINNEYKRQTEITNQIDWINVPLDQLVNHILNTHHAYLYENLPKISELTTKILRAHGENHPELLKVHRLFHQLKMEFESHLIKEETQQYPAIKSYLKSHNISDLKKAIDIIKSLEDEHTGAGNILKELREVTNDYDIPDDGCQTYDLTFKKLQELESDTFQHIHLENNILFPRLKNFL